MLKKITFLSFAMASLIIVSCHKSNSVGGGNSGQLAGNYTFLWLTAQTQSSTLQSAGGQTAKTVANTNYTTTQNTGTVTFTKDSAATHSLGYSVSTTAMTYLYENGTLIDSMSLPFSTSVSGSNSTTQYSVIGTDSIYFHGGFLSAGASGQTTVAPPSGGRFKFKGDTLIMTENISQTQAPVTSGGVTTSSSATGLATIYLLKQ